MAGAKEYSKLPQSFYALPIGDTLALLGVSSDTGLPEEEVIRRSQAYGPNILLSRRKTSAFILLAHQFQSPVFYLLAAAAALAFYFGEREESSAITIVLVLNALIGFLTELKASRSIEGLKALVIMVTDDHAVTARSIGRAVGIGEKDGRIVDGRELSGLMASNGNQLLSVDIFARASPSEKLDLVRAFQKTGAVVAMTGDGINDAPALRQANIGVAMGMRGTDVARQAAAMILLDDAFPTIVQAIREGRVIFSNIRRFVAYLVSCNLSEVTVIGLAILTALPLPILPLQILYLNLVTDVFPAFALAMGRGEQDVLAGPHAILKNLFLAAWSGKL